VRVSGIVRGIVKALPRRFIPIGAGIGIVLLLLLVFSLFVQANRLRRRVDDLVAGIGTEVENQNQLTQQLESNQRQATAHLQQVRELLNLSPGRYRFLSDITEEEGTERGTEELTTEELTTEDPIRPELLYDAITRIERERSFEELEARLSRTVPRAFEADLGTGRRLRSPGRLRWELVGESGALVRFRATEDEWRIASIAGDQESIAISGSHDAPGVMQEVAETVIRQFDQAMTELRQYEDSVQDVEAFIRTIRIDDALSAAQLVAGNKIESGTITRFPMLTSETSDEAFHVVVTAFPLQLAVDGEVFRDVDEALSFLEQRIRESDPRTAAQRATEDAIDRVREYISEDSFQRYLADRELRLGSDLRESIDFFYLDLVYDAGDRQGERFGAIAIQKDIGEVYVTNAEDVVVSSLARAGDDPFAAHATAGNSAGGFGWGFAGDGGAFGHRDGMPNWENPGGPARDGGLPEDFPPGFRAGEHAIEGTSILLVGTHENQADALILAHLSPDRTVSMISIPRDLWWNNRKLSHHAEIYGIEHLVEQVESITQRTIDGWIAVDMYAFIEVVDILGGIDVTLSEPLIDPTYRVREAGEWTTLYYEAGTHHIGGVEALRLARSRHTSNDFERAQRQQMILAALRQRVNELNAGSLDRVYELIETLNRYVTTSYSAWELAQFYLGYRNAEIANRTGLTFDNVLYNTWSNLYLQGLDRSDVDDDFYLGAWILLPRDDDWDVIPWFIEENLR
jgi:LCP family protein required for cell wall assembly